jgi:uncharacterized protein
MNAGSVGLQQGLPREPTQWAEKGSEYRRPMTDRNGGIRGCWLVWEATDKKRWYRNPSPVKTFTQHERLTDAELDRLGHFLKGCKGGSAMNVEQTDGFFAALIVGPETVMPSDYYPEVFGGDMSETCEFGSLDEANEILGLMMRHWNTIAQTLYKAEVYEPVLLQDENGMFHGNDWAHGFMRGTLMRHDGRAELGKYEHDEDSEMRPNPISPEKHEEVIVHMAAGLVGAYRYFREQRQVGAGGRTTEHGAPLPMSVGMKCVPAPPARNTSGAAAGRR